MSAPEELRPAIQPRNIHFAFDAALPADWHSNDPAITIFYDALSLTFPVGERFFIESVRRYAPRVTDPALKRDVEAFTTQEAIHSREHRAYNQLIGTRNVPVHKVERMMQRANRVLTRILPGKVQLAATCAYEHFTALFAEQLLGDPTLLADAHPFYRDLWRWHAMEEEEHKAVAFDVYNTVAPGPLGYVRRAVAMFIVTLDFFITNIGLRLWLMAKRGQLTNFKSWGHAFWHLWIAPGVWRRILTGSLSFYAPSFHPFKRKVSPQVLAWRSYYRAQKERSLGNSIFEAEAV